MPQFTDSRHCVTSACIPPLIDFLGKWNVTKQRILFNTSLETLSHTEFPDMISLGDCHQIIHNIDGISGSSPLVLGLLVGIYGRTASLGQLGFIGICSSTIDEGLRSGQKYSSLFSPLYNYNYFHDKDLAVLIFTETYDAPDTVRHFVLGLAIGGIHSMAYSLMGERFFNYLPDSTAYFKDSSTQQPDLTFLSQGRIKTFFGCPQNKITFSKALTMTPLAGGNTTALKHAISVGDRLLEDQPPQDHAIVASVATIIERNRERILSLNDVAQELGLSTRTIARHLKACNTCFSQLNTHTKMTHAKESMGNSHLSIKEIAFQLGYSEVSNFSVAFKKHVGMSPGAYRKSTR